MKRITAWILMTLALCLLLAACTPGAGRETTPSTQETVPLVPATADGPGPADWSSLTGKGKVGTVLPDFSTETADGETFTLSEALQTHELVFINLWASWCPPCNAEFPILEEAYGEFGDRVAFLALTVEEEDNMAVIRSVASSKQLSFPMGRDENYTLALTFNVSAIPTSLLVDRNRTVIWMETGAMSSVDRMRELFETYLPGETPSSEQNVYTVTVVDQNGAPVPGCVVNFCTEETCVPVIAGENGEAVFTGAPYAYHLQILSLPDGYDYEGSDDLFVRAEGDSVTLTVTKLEG